MFDKKSRSQMLALGAVLAVSLAMPAAGSAPKEGKGNKHLCLSAPHKVCEVVSFEGATLTLTSPRHEEPVSVEVAEDARVKRAHRGKPEGEGNPTKGSLEDLVAGAKVLRLKMEDGVATKVRVRPLKVEAPPPCDPATEACEGEPENAE